MKTTPTPPPRLTPPPRIGSSPTAPPRQRPEIGARRPASRGQTAARWLTGLLFVVLAVLAGAVFLVLPDWVRQQQELTGASAAAEAAPPAVEATAEVAELDVETAPPSRDASEPIPPEVPAAEPEPAEPEPQRAATLRPPSPPAAPPAAAPPAAAPPAMDRQAAELPDKASFRHAMSEGLAALDRGDFALARDAFERASELEPGSPQAADGLSRAETALRIARITQLQDQATTAVAAEDWHRAGELFGQALKLDPTILLAQQGHAESLERARLSDSLDFHVNHPERLSTAAVLEEATAVLAQAKDVEPAGQRLKRQIEALDRHVKAFSTPVPATLTSDNLTEVVVYKVGRIGTFDRHALELRPGTYTVVGSRQGYRDVRRRLVITPGVEPQPLAIRCEDKI